MKGFKWGVATAAYQIEGHFNKFRTIWDYFADQDGKVFNRDNGEVACSHFEMYKEDVRLIKELGVDTYRFSISWARIFPRKGELSKEGIDFYKNLLLELKENDIQSNVTLYHWDMPEWIYLENGGWTSRDTVDYFLEYAKVIFEELDDLVDEWVTLNEPYCSTYLGYGVGIHAPGHSTVEEFFKSIHYILLAHGETVDYYKKHYQRPIGIVVNMTHIHSATEKSEDIDAASLFDSMHHKMFLEPLFNGCYPEELFETAKKLKISTNYILKGDLNKISIGLDFFGLNYYTHTVIQRGDFEPFNAVESATDLPKTAMGWDVSAYALGEIIRRLRAEYTSLPLYITENGAAYDDILDGENIHDEDRVDYLKQHIDVVEDLKDSHNIRGYFVWSLMDNYEWAFGYSKRFGITYVDFETMKRTPKDSYYYYKNRISK